MKNKHMLICGGSGGLGRSVSTLALEKGAIVTIPYTDQKSILEFRKALPQLTSESVHFVKADLMNEIEVKNIVHSMKKVDVLIQLVGGFSMGATSELSLHEWRKQFDLNVTITFLVCKYCLPRMQENNYGRIITIGSLSALHPKGKMAAYASAKSAVLAFTKSIADETKGTNVTANCVLPGTIDTPRNRKVMESAESDQWVQPKSIAEVICFLASEEAANLRGASLPVFKVQ